MEQTTLAQNFQTTQQDPVAAAVDLMNKIRAEDNHVKQADLINALREIVVGHPEAAQRVLPELQAALLMPIYNSNLKAVARVIADIIAMQQQRAASAAQPQPVAA